jgi:hypothetical protein
LLLSLASVALHEKPPKVPQRKVTNERYEAKNSKRKKSSLLGCTRALEMAAQVLSALCVRLGCFSRGCPCSLLSCWDAALFGPRSKPARPPREIHIYT